MPAKITFRDSLDFNSLDIGGKAFNSITAAAASLTDRADKEELDNAVSVFIASRLKDVHDARADQKDALSKASGLNDAMDNMKESHALTVEDLGKTIDGLRDQLKADKTAADAAYAKLHDDASNEIGRLQSNVDGLTEQLRIAKLPPADQQKLALEDEMARLEAETQRVKALHAELLDPPA